MAWELMKARTFAEQSEPEVVVLRAAIVAVRRSGLVEALKHLGAHHDAGMADWILDQELALKIVVVFDGVVPVLVALHSLWQFTVSLVTKADRPTIEHIDLGMVIEKVHLFLEAQGLAQVVAIKASQQLGTARLAYGEV